MSGFLVSAVSPETPDTPPENDSGSDPSTFVDQEELEPSETKEKTDS